MIKKLKQGFNAAALATGIGVLSACTGTPPTATSALNDNERRLNSAEISMAREIFGNQIDYNRVVIRQTNNNTSRAFGGVVRMSKNGYSPDFSTESNTTKVSVFMHEMTHIWQEQHGVNLVDSAVSIFLENAGNYGKSYEYDINSIDNYRSLSIEQQGEIVEDYVVLRRGLNEQIRSHQCAKIEKYEDVLTPVFPGIETPKLCQ